MGVRVVAAKHLAAATSPRRTGSSLLPPLTSRQRCSFALLTVVHLVRALPVFQFAAYTRNHAISGVRNDWYGCS